MARPIDEQVVAARVREAAVPTDARLTRVQDRMLAPGTRWCSGCQSMPPRFYFAPSASRCRACSSAVRHAAMVRKEYGLEPDEYAALLELQDGRCAICRQRPVSIRLAVDHDHQTGKVRGLCCSRCNHDLLGAGWDSGDRLRAAAAYLDAPPMSGRWVAPGPPRRPGRPNRGGSVTPAEVQEFGGEAAARGFPDVLDRARLRMSADDLVLSGGKSDPETGVYWLAYRREADETPPF